MMVTDHHGSVHATIEIPVGRSLDAEVAAKVFGCTVEWFRGDEPCCGCPDRPHMDFTDYDRRISSDPNNICHYSTEIAAAWEVVDKLRFSVVFHNDKWYAGRFDGGIWDHGPIDGDLRPDPEDGYETAPEAICRAAIIFVTYYADADEERRW